MNNRINKVTLNQKGGNIINFVTTDIVGMGQYATISFNEKEYYFQINKVEAGDDSELFYVQAREVGYYNKIEVRDIRKIIGLRIFGVTDEKKIEKIYKESCYC